MLTFHDRAEIGAGVQAKLTVRQIAERIGRAPSVVSREIRRNSTKTRGYRIVTADEKARKRRARPQARKVAADPVLAARVRADLRRSRTPNQIAGRLRAEADDRTREVLPGSLDAEGRAVSHEAIYPYIYALPKGELAKAGILLRSKRTRRKPRTDTCNGGARIVGMVSIDDRPDGVDDRRVPGHWEGDLIIGAAGKSAAVTLVERKTRFLILLPLPEGRSSEAVVDTVIDHVRGLPQLMSGSITWDQGPEMAQHAALSVATDMPVYFAHPRSPWERGTNENTNGLVREYLPKGTQITTHQPHLTAIAEEMNDRPRATLGYLTPREAFNRLLVASTT
ncbi:IS30 family transposase [Aeromicrobium camelliae]|uniref:IS30 family transposase n=1 Tax=Aeromicrobium camelliae TaxID=1538144 RepID=UPI001FB7F2A0|nr:IS30 family transposase [Aeromicrobium camelliae]